MALPEFIQTILSKPDEWLSLLLGISLAAILAYVTETREGYVAALIVLVVGVFPYLPTQIVLEWHYWPAIPVAVFLFGFYKWGPSQIL